CLLRAEGRVTSWMDKSLARNADEQSAEKNDRIRRARELLEAAQGRPEASPLPEGQNIADLQRQVQALQDEVLRWRERADNERLRRLRITGEREDLSVRLS